MACVLFSRPTHDGQMSYLHHYSKELVEFAKLKNHKVINKEGIDANYKIITNIIKKQNPDFIFFNGHGSPDIICGHKNEIIISSKKNPDILSNKITYSLSCASALNLGEIAIDKGAIAFIGYKMDFALGKDQNKEAVPSKDKIAKLFLEPSNLLVMSILKGNKLKNAVEKSKKIMKNNVLYLSTTEDFPDAKHYAPFLFGNYIGLTICGDNNYSLK